MSALTSELTVAAVVDTLRNDVFRFKGGSTSPLAFALDMSTAAAFRFVAAMMVNNFTGACRGRHRIALPPLRNRTESMKEKEEGREMRAGIHVSYQCRSRVVRLVKRLPLRAAIVILLRARDRDSRVSPDRIWVTSPEPDSVQILIECDDWLGCSRS